MLHHIRKRIKPKLPLMMLKMTTGLGTNHQTPSVYGFLLTT